MHPLFHPLFIDYCVYFNGNEDYFECHEVLEEYWKEIAPGEKLHPLVGYVQLATGMYHWRRNNFAGAARIMKKAILNFETNHRSSFFEYIDFEQLVMAMSIHKQQMEAHEAFTPFKIPISNRELQLAILEKIKITEPLNSHFLLNKHMLRDRSEVIAEREKSKQLRAKKRI